MKSIFLLIFLVSIANCDLEWFRKVNGNKTFTLERYYFGPEFGDITLVNYNGTQYWYPYDEDGRAVMSQYEMTVRLAIFYQYVNQQRKAEFEKYFNEDGH